MDHDNPDNGNRAVFNLVLMIKPNCFDYPR